MLDASEIEQAFDLSDQLRNVDEIFERVFQEVPVLPGRKREGRGERVSTRMMKARVLRDFEAVRVRPAGQTIADALHSLGYADVGDVRQGKYFELDLGAASAEQARALAAEVADKVLANPVIESYR